MKLNGSVSWFDVVLYANKKFTGGVGDEDDRQPESSDLWKEYFLQDPDTADQVICMTKLNGEAAHFSGRYHIVLYVRMLLLYLVVEMA